MIIDHILDDSYLDAICLWSSIRCIVFCIPSLDDLWPLSQFQTAGNPVQIACNLFSDLLYLVCFRWPHICFHVGCNIISGGPQPEFMRCLVVFFLSGFMFHVFRSQITCDHLVSEDLLSGSRWPCVYSTSWPFNLFQKACYLGQDDLLSSVVKWPSNLFQMTCYLGRDDLVSVLKWPV